MSTPSLTDAVHRVRRVLDAIGDALVAGDVAPLLSTEEELGRALAELPAAHSFSRLSPLEAKVIADDLARCRAALGRCRRLGASLDDFCARVVAAEGRTGAYTRAGCSALPPSSRTLEAKG